MNPTPSAANPKNKYIPSNLQFDQLMYKKFLFTIIFTLCQMTKLFLEVLLLFTPLFLFTPFYGNLV